MTGILRPDFLMVRPDDVERVGVTGAYVLALVRYATADSRPPWWRASHAEMGEALGMSHDSVRRAVLKLEASEHLSTKIYSGPEGNQSKSYRIASGQPVRDSASVLTSQYANPRRPQCDSASPTTPSEVQEETHPSGVQSSGDHELSPERQDSESADPQTTSDASDPGNCEDEPTTRGEQPVKHDDHQDAIPGMHLLPVSDLPAPPETAAAKEPRTRRRSGREIDPDFVPSAESVAKIRDEFPYVTNDAMRYQLAKFIDWHLDKGTLMRNLDAAWRNWMRKADERGELSRHNGSGPASAYERKTANNLAVFRDLGEDRSARFEVER